MGKNLQLFRISMAIVLTLGLLLAGADARKRERNGSERRSRLPYTIVDTGQVRFFGNRGEIRFPGPGQPFFGQDASYDGNQPAYRDNGDGTITDLNTGLMWEKKPDFALRDWKSMAKYAGSLDLSGYHDWRLPSMKELFSLADFRGDINTRAPYIDTKYFAFKYPDTSAGFRIIDAQYLSSTHYLGSVMDGVSGVFGFNFADGRIKCYPAGVGHKRRGRRGPPVFRRFVRCVRGPAYGQNDFVDNGDGTITDRATGLMWMTRDSRRTMNWQQALEYAENLDYAGYDDWRLPNVKELHSIVDYRRAPDASSPSDRGPAIDPIFDLTSPESWFWTGTTLEENLEGVYVCFGRGLSAWKFQGKLMNAHGAGAVRSDPKSGDPSRWPDGRGPQGDQIRIYNYVRCVRGGVATLRTGPDPGRGPIKKTRPPRGGPFRPDGHHFVRRLDTNGDGKVSRSEFDGPPHEFPRLDRNGDGFLSADEAPKVPPHGHGPPQRRRPPRRY